MTFTTLSDEEQQEYWRLYRMYLREARRCERANAYLAGCVMLGSALETLLSLMVEVFADDAEKTGKIPTKKGRPKSLVDWDLGELLRVAKAAKWLPAALELSDEWNSRKARIGDHAEIVRMVRNLAHPGRYRKDHFRGRFTRRTYQRQYQRVEFCKDWLSNHAASASESDASASPG